MKNDRFKYRIKSLKILNNFLVEITFEDGKIQKINFAEVEHKGWWKELEDLTYFNKVKISDIKHLEWPNGQDFKPEHLYYWEDYRKLYMKSN